MSTSTSTVKATKLRFKGESKKRKRTRHNEDNGAGPSGTDEQDAESWVNPTSALFIRGPVWITHSSESVKYCITFNSISNKLILATLPLDASADGPTDVAQVWVATRIAGTDTIDLRTGSADGGGRFISCDTHGLVSADRSARGPQESWTPEYIEEGGGAWAFKNIYGKYLGVDEVAGGSMALRGDSDNAGAAEQFHIRIQRKYLKEVEDEKKANIEKPQNIDEAASK